MYEKIIFMRSRFVCYRVRRHITTVVLLHVLDVARSSTILSILFTSHIRLFASHIISRCLCVDRQQKKNACIVVWKFEWNLHQWKFLLNSSASSQNNLYGIKSAAKIFSSVWGWSVVGRFIDQMFLVSSRRRAIVFINSWHVDWEWHMSSRTRHYCLYLLASVGRMTSMRCVMHIYLIFRKGIFFFFVH